LVHVTDEETEVLREKMKLAKVRAAHNWAARLQSTLWTTLLILFHSCSIRYQNAVPCAPDMLWGSLNWGTIVLPLKLVTYRFRKEKKSTHKGKGKNQVWPSPHAI
jgi:hypothetical protein